MKFGSIDTSNRPMLIAEIGNNHEGSEETAYRLVEEALKAGADAVKVQIINPSRLVNISQTERIAQLSRYRLKPEVFSKMGRMVREAGKLFLASVFDCDSLREMISSLDGIKIASGDLDFHPLLRIAASSGKPMILSTGMATLPEIRESVGVCEQALPKGVKIVDRLAVLHCVSLYPCPWEQANLSAIPTLQKALGLTIGYSDHCLGLESAIVSLGLGARIIEKHFTLDKTRAGFRDHALSADPSEFAALAKLVQVFTNLMGNGERGEVTSDLATRTAARRSLVAIDDLPSGKTLQLEDLDFVRPSGAIPPSALDKVLGKRLKRPLKKHEVIATSDLD